MAPQLQQSLHLLQVPTLELRSLVQEELQQNPLLEEIPKDETRVETESPDVESPEAGADGDKATTNEERAEFKEEFEVLSKLDDEWREYFSQTNTIRSRSPEQEEQRQHFFDSIVQQESLQQHLLQQLGFMNVSEDRRKVAELIVGSINDDGYLLTPIEELSVSSGIPLEHLQEALEIVQTFHPVGVGARNLKECLLIQLDRLGKSESIEAVLVNQHLDDLGASGFPEIARAMNLSVEQVQQLANFISTLEPKPGRMFTTEQQHMSWRTWWCRRSATITWCMLNDEQIPHLRISNTYKELMASGEKSNEAQDYIRDKIRSGKFLIKSIHQRQQTIYNIAHVIVNAAARVSRQGHLLSQAADHGADRRGGGRP